MFERELKKISHELTILENFESFNNFEIVVEVPPVINVDLNILKRIVNLISPRDNIRFKFFAGEFPIAEYSTDESIEEFYEKLNQEISSNDEENYKVSIDIIKNNIENEISIYDLDLFTQYLSELSLKGIFFEFSRVLENGFVIFRMQNGNLKFNSNSIFFTSKHESINLKNEERQQKLQKRAEICNFLNNSEYMLLAGDFDFYNLKACKLKGIMDKLKIVLSIIGICDISNIKSENEVQIIINGYKRIEYIIKYKDDFIEETNEYFKIEEWIYNGGNLSDKAGIARNIISIASRNSDLMHIDDSIMASIKSAHEIYLKENIKQYLEVKNKISEFLNDMTQKTSEIANSLGKSFYNNIKVALTFYATIVIMDILSDKRLTNIFTEDVLRLTLVFIGFSFIFMLFSRHETQNEVDRFKERYKRIKESYDDVLNKDDIITIFKKDKYFKEDVRYIDKKIKNYTRYWIIILVILFVATVIIAMSKYIDLFNLDKFPIYK